MKNLLMIGSALLVLSSSAYASQSRLLALGMNETDNEGSYYISDSRNMFLNPAWINVYHDYAIAEWGDFGSNASVLSTTSAATVNTTTAPKAQGGVFKKYGDFVYGLYFGNESNTSSLLRIAGSSAVTTVNGITNTTTFAGTSSKMLQTADNQIDFFFGGDNGLKWAVNPTLAIGKDEARNGKDSAAALRVGVMASNWDAHANISLRSKSVDTDTITAPALAVASTAVTQEFKGKLGFHVGGSYSFGDSGKAFGYVKHYGWEQTDSFNGYGALGGAIGGQNGTVKGDFTSYYLGWGKDWTVNGGDKLFTSLTAKKTDINDKFTTKSEIRHLIIPLTLGYEAKATDWLVLRGSVVQNLWGRRDNKNLGNLNVVAKNLITNIYGGNGKTTISNSTAVNAGATLAFGNFSVDGLVGLSSSARTGAQTAGTNQVGTNKGALAFDNLESAVAMTYKF